MVSCTRLNPHPPMKFMRSWEKAFVRFVIEHFDSEHECSHNGYSLLILHQEMKDELMAFIYHKEKKEEDHEGSV